MASGFPFALLLCLSIGLSAASCYGQTSCPDYKQKTCNTASQKLKKKSELATDRQRSINFTCFTQQSLLLASTMKEKMSSCPPGWTQLGSRCFSFNIQGKSWIDAESFCKSKGGNLASVHSEEEHVFLRDYIRKVTGENKQTWMGGFDSVQEGEWMWSDGSTFDYKHWGPGQPDNHRVAEHCLEMNYHGKWNDNLCPKILPFLCSKKL